MEQQLTLHIVGGTSRSRAEQARCAFALGLHAEVYADLGELLHRPIASGIVVASGQVLEQGVARLIERLGSAGIWMPVVAASERPDVQNVVQAIKEGALDFLALPLEHNELGRLLAKLESEAGAHVAARRRVVEARQKIAGLSRREREVLDWLCEGCSNKEIARALDISPRTVEIHRANMMGKLEAQHAAEAVRLQYEAGLASTARPEQEAPLGQGAVGAPPLRHRANGTAAVTIERRAA